MSFDAKLVCFTLLFCAACQAQKREWFFFTLSVGLIALLIADQLCKALRERNVVKDVKIANVSINHEPPRWDRP